MTPQIYTLFRSWSHS